MSSPVAVGIAAVALAVGLPVLAAGAQLEARHRTSGAADAAALAASDAATGWIAADPCFAATEVAESARVVLSSCEIEGAEARVVVRLSVPLGSVEGRARAGPLIDGSAAGAAGGDAEGWSWPSGVRGISQGFHDGFSIDLSVAGDGGLYAPYDGVVVRAGADSGGIPAACLVNPSWWRGPNHTVLIRHEYRGRTLFSSHNHIAPGSPQLAGVTVGTRVRSGQRVASAGMSGCTSGPHTHFTLATTPTNSFPDVNPFEYIGEP